MLKSTNFTWHLRTPFFPRTIKKWHSNLSERRQITKFFSSVQFKYRNLINIYKYSKITNHAGQCLPSQLDTSLALCKRGQRHRPWCGWEVRSAVPSKDASHAERQAARIRVWHHADHIWMPIPHAGRAGSRPLQAGEEHATLTERSPCSPTHLPAPFVYFVMIFPSVPCVEKASHPHNTNHTWRFALTRHPRLPEHTCTTCTSPPLLQGVSSYLCWASHPLTLPSPTSHSLLVLLYAHF